MSSCNQCRAFAQAGRSCPRHSIESAVAANDHTLAYRIAADFGYPASTVRRLIRDKQEQEQMTRVAEEIDRDVRALRMTTVGSVFFGSAS